MGILEGKAIVVNWAGSDAGHIYAIQAALQGARVIVNDLVEEKACQIVTEIKKAGGVAEAHIGATTDWRLAKDMIEKCIQSFGRIDGLINNGCPSSEVRCDTRYRDSMNESSMLSILYCKVHALRAMSRCRVGSIVNVASCEQMHFLDTIVHSLGAGDTETSTHRWARESRQSGVRINTILPVASDSAERHGSRAHDLRSQRTARLLTYLLSDRAHDISGRIISC